MSFEESERRTSQNPPDKIANTRAELLPAVKAVTISNLFTQEIQEFGPAIIERVLQEYSISRHFEPTETFFIPLKYRKRMEKHFSTRLSNKDGAYLPELDWILVFFNDIAVIDIHTYFHEHFHALGVCRAWSADNSLRAARVGYSFSRHDEGGEADLVRGDFLEEATVNWLADRATIIFMEMMDLPRPDEKPERAIAEAVGGRAHTHSRDCLAYLAHDDDALFNLFLQARFDLSLMIKLRSQLSSLYGTGALAKLNKLESSKSLPGVQKIDRVVMSIRPE